MAYSDDVLKAKASPNVKNSKPRTREDERSRRKVKLNNGGKRKSAMSVTMVAAINAAEQEAAELEAMQKRERLLIRAMIGGFLLLVLGLARQHNPDDHGLNQQGIGGDVDGSLRGSPSLEWQGDRPNVAQHLTLETENSQDVHTKSISSESSSPKDAKYDKYMDLVDLDDNNNNSRASGNSQDATDAADAETVDELDESESFNIEDVSTESEDMTIQSLDEIEEKSLGDEVEEEEYPVDELDGRVETAEGDGH